MKIHSKRTNINENEDVVTEHACDPKAATLYELAVGAALGAKTPSGQDVAAYDYLLAALTLSMIGMSREELMGRLKELAQAAMAADVLTQSGITAQEFTGDPEAVSAKLAAYTVAKAEERHGEDPGASGGAGGGGRGGKTGPLGNN